MMRIAKYSMGSWVICGFLMLMPIWYFFNFLGAMGIVHKINSDGFSEVMGKNPQPFQKPTLKDFMSGKFQKDFEVISCERIPMFTLIVKQYKDLSRLIDLNFLKALPSDWSPVLPIGADIISSRDKSQLMRTPGIYCEEKLSNIKKRADYYNLLATKNKSCRFYIFPVLGAGNSLSLSHRYYKNKTDVLIGDRYFAYFKNKLSPNIHCNYIGEELPPESIIGLHYKTDHHLSMKGAYYAYNQIIGTLSTVNQITFDPIPVKSWHKIPGVSFRGSFSRCAGAFEEIIDEFEVAEFNSPNLSVVTSKSEASRIDKSYEIGTFSRSRFVNHYSKYFGGDRGLVEYMCNSAEDRNILIVGDSFDNPIEPFIASHYRRSYFIDYRRYHDEVGENLNISDFINKNKINDVLFIGNQHWTIGISNSIAFR